MIYLRLEGLKIKDADNGKRNIRAFSKFLNAYGITAKRLRKIGSKHASRVHGSRNPTVQHLSLLCRIAMRHKIDRLIDIGKFFLGYSSWIAERAVIKNISKPRCKDFRAFNDNLCAVHLGKEKVLLNKPIYVGSAVLDLRTLHKINPSFQSKNNESKQVKVTNVFVTNETGLPK
ncbi:3113_t:CDS:2 [Entrophospora sp. SA101]|nr:3113_t:CDS:2 [Entrophospora sp. SA101]